MQKAREGSYHSKNGVSSPSGLLWTYESINYILAEVELITDWKRFGAWVKKIDYIIPVASDQQ